MVGPYNPDFGSWGSSVATGTAMECAARPTQAIQYLDARDLAVDRFHLTHDGTFQLSNARALTAGLEIRPAEESARACVEWIRAGNTPPPPPH